MTSSSSVSSGSSWDFDSISMSSRVRFIMDKSELGEEAVKKSWKREIQSPVK